MKSFQSVGKWISVLYRFTQSYQKKKLEPYNLGPGQLPILIMLFHKEQVRQVDLANRLQLDKTSLARTISKMEEHGYIERKKDDQDSRAYSICLTPKARQFKNELIPILKNWTKILLQDFTPNEQDQFTAFLSRAAENAKKELKGENYGT